MRGKNNFGFKCRVLKDPLEENWKRKEEKLKKKDENRGDGRRPGRSDTEK